MMSAFGFDDIFYVFAVLFSVIDEFAGVVFEFYDFVASARNYEKRQLVREKLFEIVNGRASEFFESIFRQAILFEHPRLFGRIFPRPRSKVENGRVEIDFIHVFGIKKR